MSRKVNYIDVGSSPDAEEKLKQMMNAYKDMIGGYKGVKFELFDKLPNTPWESNLPDIKFSLKPSMQILKDRNASERTFDVDFNGNQLKL